MADEDEGTGTDTLGVVVYGATVTIADLIAAVELLVEQGVLSQGRGNSLVVKAEAAQAALDAGGMQAAVESLRAFVNEVKALENAGILGEQQAEDLVDLAKAVIAAISRPGLSSTHQLRRQPRASPRPRHDAFASRRLLTPQVVAPTVCGGRAASTGHRDP